MLPPENNAANYGCCRLSNRLSTHIHTCIYTNYRYKHILHPSLKHRFAHTLRRPLYRAPPPTAIKSHTRRHGYCALLHKEPTAACRLRHVMSSSRSADTGSPKSWVEVVASRRQVTLLKTYSLTINRCTSFRVRTRTRSCLREIYCIRFPTHIVPVMDINNHQSISTHTHRIIHAGQTEQQSSISCRTSNNRTQRQRSTLPSSAHGQAFDAFAYVCLRVRIT